VSRIKAGLDFNCSSRMVGALDALFGHRGFEFLHLEKLVKATTRDEIWADTFKRFGGKVVISGDPKIAYKPHQALAFIDNGLISFFPAEPFSHFGPHERCAVIIHAWPVIEEKIVANAVGTCWRIPCPATKSELKLQRPTALEPLRIPDDVLQRFRKQRGAA
jgi:hypothetical protein